jgi:thiol:disulfide interchange protein
VKNAMVRSVLLFLLAAVVLGRASDFIPPPKEGVSKSVSQPHVTAELISETTYVTPGKPFLVALHLHMDPDWHTYWINPGDAGLATTITWTLPPGFTAGPIQWPTPEIHKMGPETTYGYGGDVYLLTTITPSMFAPTTVISNGGGLGRFGIKAKATWLVCQEECIPGKAELDLKLDDRPTSEVDFGSFFMAEAKKRLPVPNTRWDVEAAYQHVGLGESLVIHFKDKGAPTPLGYLYFFPEQQNALAADESANQSDAGSALSEFNLVVPLQQNGEKPAQISGVLVSDQPLIGDTRAVYLASFNTAAVDIPPVTSASLAPAEQSIAALSPSKNSEGQVPPLHEEHPFLLAILGAAFLGGIILNLMPCVLPVLSLKVFSLIRHAGENPRGAWRQGAAFTAGVVLSFWALAGVLLALRAAGGHLGWGFQMQSPGFVLALIFVFFLLALNLFGVFELGTSLVGLDAKAAAHTDGLLGSFLNGALATLAATPCTAPFMGSALGFAAEQPPAVSLLVFTALALGMAAPYLLLTIFPGALRFVPKPGAWMEAVKQFMGFLLLATVIFLVYVFGALVGEAVIPELLFGLLLAAIVVWIYGRWGILRAILFVMLLGLAYEVLGFMTPKDEVWQPWTPAAVDAALGQGRPVFVDFTAAWCLSCKVNERVALETDEVRAAFAQKNVALFRADWTHADPAISATLQQYHRDGVPLYLYYTPAARDAPEVLPEVLTPGIVLDALNKG